MQPKQMTHTRPTVMMFRLRIQSKMVTQKMERRGQLIVKQQTVLTLRQAQRTTKQTLSQRGNESVNHNHPNSTLCRAGGHDWCV